MLVSDEMVIKKIHELNNPLKEPYCTRSALREALLASGRDISDKDLNKQLRRLENERKVVCCTCGDCEGNISIKREFNTHGSQYKQTNAKKYF